MNQEVVKIVNNNSLSKQEKIKELDRIIREAKDAKDKVEQYTYCAKCDDYYLTKSFFEETETRDVQICTFHGIINSGDNEYAPGRAVITYRVCPKGHRHEINREETLIK